MTYQIRYYKEFSHYQLIAGDLPTLEAARDARKLSGDLVFKDGEIVDDLSWLWDWEKEEGKNPVP